MKLQISFDHTDLDQALDAAAKVQQYADILEVGSLLIYKYGVTATTKFKEKFPDKLILSDAKIIDRSKDAVTMFAIAGSDWITILSGASKSTIQSATMTAHELGKKIMLDLIDSTSLGQSALEAKGLGVDALVFHKDHKEIHLFLEEWEMVKGNTSLPIFIHTIVNKDNISELLTLGAAGIIATNMTFEKLEEDIEVIESIKETKSVSQ